MESTAWAQCTMGNARAAACLLIALLTTLGTPVRAVAAPSPLSAPESTARVAPAAAWLDQVSTTANLTIFLSLTTPSGQPAAGSLAGYSFSLSGPNGATPQVLVTNQLGQVTLAGLEPGVYSIAETPLTGANFSSMTINGVGATQQQPFQIQAGGNYNVNVTNTVNGSGNVSVQVQLVDANGQTIPNASLSGFSFTFTSQAGGSTAPTLANSSGSGQAGVTLSPGAYAIGETAAAGASLINYVINGVPTATGQFTLALGQTVTIFANNRAATANVTGGNRAVPLSAGCNNIASTFPDGTTGQALVSAISPATSVSVIWRFDNSAQVYKSVYFPTTGSGAPQPIDVTALNRFDALWVCVNAPATLNEPSP